MEHATRRRAPATTAHRRIAAPLGDLVLVARDGRLSALHLPGSTAPDPADLGPEDPDLLPDAVAQLAEYVAGTRTTFDLDLDLVGTDFQRRVWSHLATIPYGTTVSYGDVATHVGGPLTTRAVGVANGANPVPIIVACHRVIGADGSLAGYAGGLVAKRWLLDHESGAATLFDP